MTTTNPAAPAAPLAPPDPARIAKTVATKLPFRDDVTGLTPLAGDASNRRYFRIALKGAPSAALFSIRFLAARYGSSVRLPGFFVRNAARRYAFHFHAEHAPDPESRVTLSEARDALGLPRARIDLRFGEADARSILATHDAMDARLRAAGIARIEHRLPEAERAAAILALASDGFHQVGTARMAADPKRGVVDADARVHGSANLFLAGSAIFPSSGQANPTYLAVALAARLAAHLKRVLPELP
jgi:choline dehydrogenase-like flavoprotein